MKSVVPYLAVAAVALSFGCATDPNKQMKAADAEHAADVSDTNKDKAAMEANQEKDHAALDSTHTKQDATMDKQVADNNSKFDQKKDAAEANFVEARRSFKAAAAGRLDVVAAKATALDAKRAAKKVSEPGIATLRTHWAAVKASVAALDTVSDANWFATQKTVDASLSDLEKEAKDIESRL